MPVIGIGTNAYDVSSPGDVEARREVLRAMPELGARLIDTARGYGRSEEVIGGLLAELGTRDRFVSHPAITAVIPGTTTLAHLNDNLGGGRGRLPDAALRRRMERLWADL